MSHNYGNNSQKPHVADKKHTTFILCNMFFLGWKTLKELRGPREWFSFFFFFCRVMRSGSSRWQFCVFLNWGCHTGGHAWSGVLRLSLASPWQQLALCSQLAFSRLLISNMVCSGLQRPFEKIKNKKPEKQTDGQTFRCDLLTSRAFNMMCALLYINDDAVVCHQGL